MELEVRVVGGIESCFASLPLSLIQALESTSGGPLPSVLALELQSRSGGCWHLAWSGSASRSSAIEVDQQMAECVSLPDRTEVHVKAVANLPKAAFVSIEPSSEDDWEILELNSELAEEAILKQVGIMHEGMRFPLWLHRHVVVAFLVVSTSPKKSVVQLVPGTEVAVAPKRRKKRADDYQDVQKHSSVTEQCRTKALLRVQAPDRRDISRFVFKGVELGVVLTSVVFLHPETARKLSFDNLQLVIVCPKLPPTEIMQNGKDISLRRGSNHPVAERNNEVVTSKVTTKNTVVRILFSDSVAKGHVILPQSLGLFLRAGVHSWVYVKNYCNYPKKDLSLMTLTPCRFKLLGMNKPKDNSGIDILESNTNLKRKSIPSGGDLFLNANVYDWSHHEAFLTSFSHDILVHGGEEGAAKKPLIQEKKFLIQSWVIGQLKGIAS